MSFYQHSSSTLTVDRESASGESMTEINGNTRTADSNKIYYQWTHTLYAALNDMRVSDRFGNMVPADEAFIALMSYTMAIKVNRNEMFFVGNGASASMASHIAADLCKNGRIRTRALLDSSLLTAVANDIGVDDLFAEPLSMQANRGDMLVAVSSSGSSPNIIKAVNAALAKELKVITFSAMRAENPLRRLGHLNFYVPTMTYGFAETAHAAILHHWVDLVVEN